MTDLGREFDLAAAALTAATAECLELQRRAEAAWAIYREAADACVAAYRREGEALARWNDAKQAIVDSLPPRDGT
jgi:hypothetical protein